MPDSSPPPAPSPRCRAACRIKGEAFVWECSIGCAHAPSSHCAGTHGNFVVWDDSGVTINPFGIEVVRYGDGSAPAPSPTTTPADPPDFSCSRCGQPKVWLPGNSANAVCHCPPSAPPAPAPGELEALMQPADTPAARPSAPPSDPRPICVHGIFPPVCPICFLAGRSGDGDPTPPEFDLDAEMNAFFNATQDEDEDKGERAQDAIYGEFGRLRAALASQRAARARAEQPDVQATIHDCLEVCAARGWSLHWTARGAYLHLESSELIEAWRGKGTSTVAEEAGDVLLVLFSILGAANVPWADALGCARAKLDDLRTRPRYPGEEFTAPPAGQPEAVRRDA